MNRETKFKGKRIDNGEWVYGNLIYSEDAEETDGFFTLIIPQKDSNCFTDGIGDLGFECWHKVIPETVGQYTGLKDRNGKEIYEGYVVKIKYFRSEYLGKVIYNKKTCGFEIWYNSIVGAYGEKATHKINFATDIEIEVIGNIHDNPELLEVANGQH